MQHVDIFLIQVPSWVRCGIARQNYSKLSLKTQTGSDAISVIHKKLAKFLCFSPFFWATSLINAPYCLYFYAKSYIKVWKDVGKKSEAPKAIKRHGSKIPHSVHFFKVLGAMAWKYIRKNDSKFDNWWLTDMRKVLIHLLEPSITKLEVTPNTGSDAMWRSRWW